MEEGDNAEVPVEVWYRVLKFLNPTELCAVKTVCRDWTHYILSDLPWIQHMKQQFGTRYEKARFLLDPSLTSKDRFWRAHKLHQNWTSGERVSETLGGVLGYIRQIRLEGSVMALNLGDKIKAFDMNVSKAIWQSHEDLTAYHRITSFDLWKNLVIFPGTTGTPRIPENLTFVLTSLFDLEPSKLINNIRCISPC